MAHIKSFKCGMNYVTVKKNDYGEFVCRLHVNGKHIKAADSFHSERDDAEGTAKYMAEHGVDSTQA